LNSSKEVLFLDYRPTVRYPNEFKKYVDDLFHATHLDRNQIFRAAMFFFGKDDMSQMFLEFNKKIDCKLPSPLIDQYPNHEFFMNFTKNQCLTIGGRGVTNSEEGRTSEKIIVKSKGIKLIVRGDDQ
jgi:hypothetical protein